MILNIILTLIIGIISGILGGAFGIGGILIVPGLMLFNIIPAYKMAVGTTLLAMLPPISILAVVDYYKRNKIDYFIASLLCISYIIGAKYGALINQKYSVKSLKYWSSIIFFIFGFYFVYTGYVEK